MVLAVAKATMTNRLRKPSTKKILLAVSAAIIAIVMSFFPGIHGHREALVVKVFDGDTVQLDGGEKVRLIGIDTPELHESDKLRADSQRTGQDILTIKAMGKKAYEFTNSWVLGQRVRLEFDVQRRDKYGRLLAYIYLPFPRPPLSTGPRAGFITSRDGKKWYFLNGTIIQSGYATPMTIPPNVKYSEIFQALYQQAREYKLGLWAEKKTKSTRKQVSVPGAAP